MEVETFTPEGAVENNHRTATRFLQSAQQRRKVVTVEAEGVDSFDVEVRSIRARERAEFFRRASEDTGEALANYNVDIVMGFCYEPGTDNLFFHEDEREALLDAIPGPIEFLVNEIHVLSGLDQTARSRAGKGSS